MSVVGSLEDLSFPDILQVVHLSRQSGTLILAGPEGARRVRFRDGLVCDASLGDSGPPLEEILVSRGVVPPAALDPARARCRETGESLAASLVALGALSQDTLEKVVREELRSTLRSLVMMQEGEFRFELDEGAPPPEEAALGRGLEPEAILTDLPGAGPPRWAPGPDAGGVAVPRRVLLVSERSFLTLTLREELEHVGFEAVACDAAEEGLRRARDRAARREPFLLVVDLVLPDRTRTGWSGGLDLVRQVREVAPDLVSIVIGEVRHPSATEAARVAGATGYLALPDLAHVPFEDVGVRVRDFCSRLGATLCLSEQLAEIDWGGGAGVVRVVDPLSLLRGLIGELNASQGGDVGLLVLRLAGEYFERAALFAVRDGQAVCRGAFGDPIHATLRGAAFPLDPGSVLRRVVEAREPCIGPLPEDDANAPLRDGLGQPTAAAALLPVLGGREVLGLLYGDNARTGSPFEDFKALEIFLSQAGLALQNALLRRRLERLASGVDAPEESAA